MATINISLPASLYTDAKKYLKKRGYTSMSEFIRDALRQKIYPELTENGFTPEFEEKVLRAAEEPIDESKVWNTEEDIDRYFRDLKKELKLKKNAKS